MRIKKDISPYSLIIPLLCTPKDGVREFLFNITKFRTIVSDNSIAKHASDSDKQTGMGEDLTLFEAHKQVFLQQIFKTKKFGIHFPSISLRTRLCCLTLAGFQ